MPPMLPPAWERLSLASASAFFWSACFWSAGLPVMELRTEEAAPAA